MKERLTGAIILVVLIVLLVPELLSGPKGPAATPQPAGAASPSSEEPPLRSYTINLAEESHSQSETSNGAAGTSGPPQPQPTPQAATPEKDLTESSTWDSSSATPDGQAANPNSVPANPATVPAAAPSPQSADREQPPVRTATPPNSSASASQRSAKPSPAAATAPKSNPPAAKVASSTESSKPAAPKSIPPTSHGVAADKEAAKPHQAKSVPESGGWGVQLGVFASKENADRLALDVRTKGFKASVSAFTSGKRKLYRVRVGPAADKSAAQELQSKLKAAGRPGGAVVPYS